MERKEGGRGGEKMSRQCPLCIGWVSPRAFVMLYTDPLFKVAMWLPVQLFSYSVLALFLSLLCDFFFICDCRADYYLGATDYPQKRQQKRQNKLKAAKILILIRMGEVSKNSSECKTIQASLSYLQTKKKKRKKNACDKHLMTLMWSVMSKGESLSRPSTRGGGNM